ncbi:hypothetical protein [Streptomyces yatensis]|uniref:Uncharacterized protein n=1 Tax=Streptomyces yatensis TaxID=155177 RepID=A0ABN2IEI4_9ACTN|nr:hypothetical protein [Streptomyces yatensis]
MSAVAADGHKPLIPHPKTTVEDPRTALVQIAPNRVAAFDAERTAAVEAASSQVNVIWTLIRDRRYYQVTPPASSTWTRSRSNSGSSAVSQEWPTYS